MKKVFYFVSFLILVLIDQGTKLVAMQNLKGKEAFQLIPKVLHFTYHENDGAVWGILSGRVNFITIFSCFLFILILVIFLFIPNEKRYFPIKFIFMFVLAGGIGNVIDRIHYGFVVDFIYFVPIDFPVFNIADCYLTVSAFLLFILAIFYYKEEDLEAMFPLILKKKKEANNNDE